MYFCTKVLKKKRSTLFLIPCLGHCPCFFSNTVQSRDPRSFKSFFLSTPYVVRLQCIVYPSKHYPLSKRTVFVRLLRKSVWHKTRAYRRHSFDGPERSFVFLSSTRFSRQISLTRLRRSRHVNEMFARRKLQFPTIGPWVVIHASRTVRFKRRIRTELDENERWRREIVSNRTTRMSSLQQPPLQLQ